MNNDYLDPRCRLSHWLSFQFEKIILKAPLILTECLPSSLRDNFSRCNDLIARRSLVFAACAMEMALAELSIEVGDHGGKIINRKK